MGRSCVRSATLDSAQIDPAWTGPISSEVRSLGGDRVQDVEPSGSASRGDRRQDAGGRGRHDVNRDPDWRDSDSGLLRACEGVSQSSAER